MIKRGVSARGGKNIAFAETFKDITACPSCGKKYSVRTASKNENKCPYCGAPVVPAQE